MKLVTRDYNEWRAQSGLPPALPQLGNRTVHNVYLSKTAYNNLLTLARHFGMKAQRGPTTNQPSISQLIEAIGLNAITLQWHPDWQVYDNGEPYPIE